MKIREITLTVVEMPLVTPYRLSYRTYESFQPIIVEVRDEDGRAGWAEAHISPGSSTETPGGGWAFARDHAERSIGRRVGEAKALVLRGMEDGKVAATGLLAAFEMLEGNPLLEVAAEARLPLLTAFSATGGPAIADEVERRLEEGFATFKIKVGKNVDADIATTAEIQQAIGGRAVMRIDANRGYNRQDGCRFASSLDPAGIELFEQPCDAGDWDANAAVAAVSSVPLMLDEPICSLADIERAGPIEGVGLCKLKLKRFGGLDLLHAALLRVRALGMEPVLGDGLGGELSCWMEACVARTTIRNTGEFNGYLKPVDRLLANPLPFDAGCLVLPAGYRPEMDRERLAAHTLQSERFAPPSAAATG